MCIVSNVTDYYRKQWPDPFEQSKLNGVWITQEQWSEYQRLKKNAAELDKVTGQPDCIKPEVDEWEKKIVEVLKKKGILPK